MPGLGPGIHAFASCGTQGVDPGAPVRECGHASAGRRDDVMRAFILFQHRHRAHHVTFFMCLLTKFSSRLTKTMISTR
jgi:hypothetical protein